MIQCILLYSYPCRVRGKDEQIKKKLILYTVQLIIKASQITETYNSIYCILINNL